MSFEQQEMQHGYMPEDEYGIDIKQYIEILIRWRREILLITVLSVFAVVAIGVLLRLLSTPTYEAVATVAIVRTRSEVSFDDRFVTASDEVELRLADNVASRRASLVGLVKTSALANAVVAELGDFLNKDEQNLDNLLKQITAETPTIASAGNNTSDLILIKARSNHPLKAETLANTWAKLYVEQVNSVYGQTPVELLTSVDAELSDAQTEYDATQQKLEDFIRDNSISRLNRLILEKNNVIDSLKSGQQTALDAFIDEVVSSRRDVISAYLSAQAQNQLVAFNSEQKSQQALVTEYLDAVALARTQPFQEQVQELTTALSTAYAKLRQTESFLEDARLLRMQVETGGDSAAESSSLALFLLKAEVFGNAQNTSGLILQVDALPQLTQAEFLTDVDAVISALQTRITELEAMIGDAEADLLSGSAFTNLGAEVPEDSALMDAVREQYPRLFETGDIARLSSTIPDNNSLAIFGQERAAELLALTGLEDLPSFSAADLPLSQAIDELETEIQALSAEREAEQSTLRRLTAKRDLASESLDTLENKAAELKLSSGVLNSEVRLAASAIAPNRAIPGPSLIKNAMLAAVLGLLLGIGYAFFASFMGARPFLARRTTA